MVTVVDSATVTCELVCAVCGRDIEPGEASLVLTKLPQAVSEAMCQYDWTMIMASCYAWLTPDGDRSPDAVKRRSEEALRVYLGRDG